MKLTRLPTCRFRYPNSASWSCKVPCRVRAWRAGDGSGTPKFSIAAFVTYCQAQAMPSSITLSRTAALSPARGSSTLIVLSIGMASHVTTIVQTRALACLFTAPRIARNSCGLITRLLATTIVRQLQINPRQPREAVASKGQEFRAIPRKSAHDEALPK